MPLMCDVAGLFINKLGAVVDPTMLKISHNQYVITDKIISVNDAVKVNLSDKNSITNLFILSNVFSINKPEYLKIKLKIDHKQQL